MTKKLAFRLVFFLYLAAVLVLCFANFTDAPSVTQSILGIPTDKIVHFCMFFPFPVLAFLAFDTFTKNWRTSLLFAIAAFGAGIILALVTEWGQAHLTTWRSGDPKDFAADIIALGVSSILVFILDIRKQRK